jgi:DNA modification methylase
MTATTVEEEQQGAITNIIISDRHSKYLRPQTPAEFEALKESIRKNGQLVPGVKNQNNVLIDAHHRYKACQELGIPFKCEKRYFENEEAEIEYIHDVNVKRRHYTEFELAQQELKRKAELVESARRNMSLGGQGVSIETPLGRVNDKLAKDTGGMISGTTLFRTEKILEAVKENPTTYSDLLTHLQDNKIKVSKAYNLIKKDQKRAKVKAEIEEATKGLKLPEKVILLNKDSTKIEELTDIKDNSVDLIVTDPPYAHEYLYLYDSLAKLASQKLREGGSVVFYPGQLNIAEVIQMFSKYPNLTYWWMLAVKHALPGNRIHVRGVRNCWKGMLWYVKGKKKLVVNDVDDFIQSSAPDKNLHPWAQSSVEAEFIIKNLTVSEFSLVVDPFLGSGTFAIPAIKLNRYFIGIDSDKQAFEDAKKYITSKTGKPIPPSFLSEDSVGEGEGERKK